MVFYKFIYPKPGICVECELIGHSPARFSRPVRMLSLIRAIFITSESSRNKTQEVKVNERLFCHIYLFCLFFLSEHIFDRSLLTLNVINDLISLFGYFEVQFRTIYLKTLPSLSKALLKIYLKHC